MPKIDGVEYEAGATFLFTGIGITSRPFANWTTEALKEYEERLYDAEREGEDSWFERDQVLWELNSRT